MQHPFNQGAARRLGGIAVLACLSSPAWGEPTAAQPARTQAQQPAPERSAVRVDFGPAAELGKLEQSRGGTDTRNDMRLDGMVTGNSATNVSTGANMIDTGAFSNMSGIPVVIQNSGANVLIQSATIINVQFK